MLTDWTLALMFPREIVSMEAIEHSRAEFTLAASAATRRAFGMRATEAPKAVGAGYCIHAGHKPDVRSAVHS
ncbi:hypothetical protein [Streptomyces sp. NPDC004721]